MNSKIEVALQERIQAFATDVTVLLQRAVANSVASTLGGAGSVSGKRGRGFPTRGARGARGVAVELDVLLREVTKEGGRRVEEIAKTLGVPSKSVGTSMKKLLVAKKVKAKGKARGTRYSAA